LGKALWKQSAFLPNKAYEMQVLNSLLI
jgi:hypothetical protein